MCRVVEDRCGEEKRNKAVAESSKRVFRRRGDCQASVVVIVADSTKLAGALIVRVCFWVHRSALSCSMNPGLGQFVDDSEVRRYCVLAGAKGCYANAEMLLLL